MDWMSPHNHAESTDQEIAGMSISIHTINRVADNPVCTSIEDIRAPVSVDAELKMLQAYIIKGWPQNKDEIEPS